MKNNLNEREIIMGTIEKHFKCLSLQLTWILCNLTKICVKFWLNIIAQLALKAGIWNWFISPSAVVLQQDFFFQLSPSTAVSFISWVTWNLPYKGTRYSARDHFPTTMGFWPSSFVLYPHCTCELFTLLQKLAGFFLLSQRILLYMVQYSK